jgi:two-component system OmpR family sensor kinase
MGTPAARDDGEKRLLATLERLLAIEATEMRTALGHAAQLVAEALGADKVDAFVHDPATDTLVAVGVSDTPMGHRERAIGMDRLPLANGGRTVEVFLTGQPYVVANADQDSGELIGIVQGLGVRSTLAAPLLVAGERRGVFLAASSQADFFSTRDIHFLEAVGHWVGMVAHRAELVEHIARDAVVRGRRVAAEELVTVLAHDLRNYLTPLRARIDLIRRRARRENRRREVQDADIALQELERLSRLINDLLDGARLEQGIFAIEPEPFDLADLARQTAHALTTPTTPVVVDAPDELVITADPNRVRQALENLLANALKHSPQGAPVTITVERRKRARAAWAIVTVADRGPGIPPDVLPRLFDRFAAGSGSTGLGLGLYLARRIAEVHGGTLTVDSRPGKGATFHLALPAEASHDGVGEGD